MKKTTLNIYDLHKKTILWERYEQRRAILKYLQNAKHRTRAVKHADNLKRWDGVFSRSISSQTNVCRRSGMFKRVFNLIGFNRHAIRQHLNVGALPNLKKLHW